MEAGQRRRGSSALVVLALINALLAQHILRSEAFPALFNRPRLFQRNQAQPLPAGAQVQPSVQNEQLVLAANSLMPVSFMAQEPLMSRPQVHPDLLRMSARPAQRQLEYLKQAAAMNEFASAMAPRPAPSYAQMSLNRPSMVAGLERSPSQSEIVDKIERHIGHQIDQSLSSGDEQRAVAATGYHSSEPEEPQEKHEEAEQEEVGAGEEPEKKAKKEPEQKQEAEQEQEQEQEKEKEKHHEQPPEAFEVHHKKGGKSFQYFHQGHSH